jgi:large subunit ribosomal protein L14
MIQSQTLLKIIDNSGAKTARCIKVLGGSRKRSASVGDIIVVAVQQVRSRGKYKSKVKKGEVFRAVIVQTKSKINRYDGHKIKFDINAAVLLNKQEKPISTRILSPVTQELRTQKLMKVAVLSTGLL